MYHFVLVGDNGGGVYVYRGPVLAGNGTVQLFVALPPLALSVPPSLREIREWQRGRGYCIPGFEP